MRTVAALLLLALACQAVLEVESTLLDIACPSSSLVDAIAIRLHVTAHSDEHFEAVVSESEWQALADRVPECDIIGTHERRGLRETVPAGYQSLAEIYERLNATALAFPNITALVDMSVYSPGESVEGRSMAVLKISDNAFEDEDEPNILINSEHHAREVVTPVIALYIIDQLTKHYDTDLVIRSFVDNNQIFVAPLWNPDGYNYMYDVDYNWRKNRALNADGSHGVDLNRNYDLGWDSPCGGSIVQPSETYRGPAPNSEPETQTMVSFSEAMNFNKMLDFHSYGREVLYGYDCTKLYEPLRMYLQEQATYLAEEAQYDIRVPSADGEHPEWNTQVIGSYAFIVETATEFQPPYDEAIQEAERVWPLVRYFLLQQAPVQGHIQDVVTGAPIQSTIQVIDASGTNIGVQRQSNKHGYFTLFLPSGSYMLSISPAGYYPTQVDIELDGKVDQISISLYPTSEK